MCGIAGFSNGLNINDAHQCLINMLDMMRHRGPDSQGIHMDSCIALGANRLSIVDIKNGTQPYYNESRDIIVVFNGEIYNHLSLRGLINNHQLHSDCDGDVLSHLYEEYGVSFLDYLDGMFAIALWDSKLQNLLIACDSSGIKPLYYMDIRGSGFVFASELKAFKSFSGNSFAIDPISVAEFLQFKAIPPPHSIYKDVYKLLPGEAIIRNKNSITKFQFKSNVRTNDLTLEDLFVKEVRSTLMGDVEVGCILSGGLDSSLVTQIASEYSADPLHVFTVGYPGNLGDDESIYARKIAADIGANFHKITVLPQDIPFLLKKVIWYLDEPIQNPVCIPFFCLMNEIKKSLKVVLTGDGADELFGGYTRYKIWTDSMPNSLEEYINELCLFTKKDLKYSLLKERQNEMLIDREAQIKLLKTNNLMSAMNWELNYRQPSYHLARIDKLSMACGIEARVPFLRPAVVTCAKALKKTDLIRNGIEKYALKKAAYSHLPKWVIERKKKPFSFPISAWLNHDLNDWIYDELGNYDSKLYDWVEPQYVQHLLQQLTKDNERHNRQLWSLLTLQTFLANHTEKEI